MSSSVTYLALDLATGDLLGYFTLMMKAYSVKAAELTSANRRLVKRSSEIDAEGNLTTSVYLIAQIGKNYALPEERRISGAELLELALMVFRGTKKAIGGKLVMVEREIDRPGCWTSTTPTVSSPGRPASTPGMAWSMTRCSPFWTTPDP